MISGSRSTRSCRAERERQPKSVHRLFQAAFERGDRVAAEVVAVLEVDGLKQQGQFNVELCQTRSRLYLGIQT